MLSSYTRLALDDDPNREKPLTRDALAREALAHVDTMYGLARSLAGSDGAAEDLVQDAFARALAAHQSFRRGTNLRAWLCRILRNAFIDGRRHEKASPERQMDDDMLESRAADSSNGEPLRGDRELELLRGIVAAEIERALASLTPDARLIVLLDVEGFSEPELASILGCAQGTVKSRLSRARVLLRAALRDYAR